MYRSALHIVLAVTLLLAGCSALSSDEVVREQNATDALNASRDSVASVESYRADVSFRIETESGREAVSGEITGRVNVSARRMVSNPSVGGRTLNTYVDNRTLYQESAVGVVLGRTGRHRGGLDDGNPARSPARVAVDG